jgi:hypothetical protein
MPSKPAWAVRFGTTTFKPSLIVTKQISILGALSGRAKAYGKALDFIAAA